MLDEIVERSGLLVALDGGERYRFTHQTFQEFLVADKLRGRPEDLLARFEADPDAWREVVKLWCGLADDCTMVVQRVERREPISALECLADAANIDPRVATALITPLRDELQTGLAPPAMERAFGAVASDPRPRGRAAFADLSGRFVREQNPVAAAALGRALSYTNLPAAAELLAARCEREATVRASLVRMGDLAVPVLAELLQEERAEWPIEALLQIATPDAALALLPALNGRLRLAAPAAWALAALLANDVVRARLCSESVRDRLPARSTVGIAAWMWDPFAAALPQDAALATVVGQIVPLMQISNPPSAVTHVEPRIALACTVLAGGLSGALDRSVVADQGLLATVAHQNLVRRPWRRSLPTPGEPIKLAQVVEALAASYARSEWRPLDRLAAAELIVHAAARDSERWRVCLRSLPATQAWKVVLGTWRQRSVSRATWNMVTQRPRVMEQSRSYHWLIGITAAASVVSAAVVVTHVALQGLDLLSFLAVAALAVGWRWMLSNDLFDDEETLLLAILSPLPQLIVVAEALVDRTPLRSELDLLPPILFLPALVLPTTLALARLVPLPVIAAGWLVLAICFTVLWFAARWQESAGRSFVAGMFANAATK